MSTPVRGEGHTGSNNHISHTGSLGFVSNYNHVISTRHADGIQICQILESAHTTPKSDLGGTSDESAVGAATTSDVPADVRQTGDRGVGR